MDVRRVSVFCGTSATRDPVVEKEIRTFGQEVARRGITLVYGGSSLGLMGTLADAAISAGGQVIGVIPETLVGREAAHKGVELKVVDTMHDRDQTMSDLGDAFVAFPGGFGTLDQLMEMITWKQLGIHGKPIVIANLGGYFDPLVHQFENAIRSGYARPEHRILYALADNTQAILTLLEGAPVLERKPGDWA